MASYNIKKILKKHMDEESTDALKYYYSLLLKFTRIKVLAGKYLIRWKFKKTFGHRLSFDNPKTFNEKLQWKKIYDRRDIYVECADKYRVREYVGRKIGKRYLIPLLYVTEHPEKINFEEISEPFVIKSNHASGHIILAHNKKSLDYKRTIKKLKRWLNINYYYTSLEWPYKNISPKILIERMMLGEKGNIPEDYKFHCFNGKVEAIQVDSDRYKKRKRIFFDKNWNMLPFTLSPKMGNRPMYAYGGNKDKPGNLKEMIDVAEKLSREFDYVRVDLYSLKKKVYFGELTFTHGSGFESFFPEKYDRIFGDKLKLKG